MPSPVEDRSCVVAKDLRTAGRTPAGSPRAADDLFVLPGPRLVNAPVGPPIGFGGGRSWWAHLEFTRIHTKLTILRNQIEELMNVRGVGEVSFPKLKSLLTLTPPKMDRAAAQTP
jgi:hypothetical protein